jgi:hypothetical protein
LGGATQVGHSVWIVASEQSVMCRAIALRLVRVQTCRNSLSRAMRGCSKAAPVLLPLPPLPVRRLRFCVLVVRRRFLIVFFFIGRFLPMGLLVGVGLHCRPGFNQTATRRIYSNYGRLLTARAWPPPPGEWRPLASLLSRVCRGRRSSPHVSACRSGSGVGVALSS